MHELDSVRCTNHVKISYMRNLAIQRYSELSKLWTINKHSISSANYGWFVVQSAAEPLTFVKPLVCVLGTELRSRYVPLKPVLLSFQKIFFSFFTFSLMINNDNTLKNPVFSSFQFSNFFRFVSFYSHYLCIFNFIFLFLACVPFWSIFRWFLL